MFSRRFLLVSSLAAAAIFTGAWVQSADAAPRDKAFFQSISGTWSGPGEIVAGKYKGTKFTCNLTGKPSDGGSAGVPAGKDSDAFAFLHESEGDQAWDVYFPVVLY